MKYKMLDSIWCFAKGINKQHTSMQAKNERFRSAISTLTGLVDPIVNVIHNTVLDFFTVKSEFGAGGRDTITRNHLNPCIHHYNFFGRMGMVTSHFQSIGHHIDLLRTDLTKILIGRKLSNDKRLANTIETNPFRIKGVCVYVWVIGDRYIDREKVMVSFDIHEMVDSWSITSSPIVRYDMAFNRFLWSKAYSSSIIHQTSKNKTERGKITYWSIQREKLIPNEHELYRSSKR